MGKYVEDNESPDLHEYDVDVLDYAKAEYRLQFSSWEAACKRYREEGYKGVSDYNPWKTLVGIELEMNGEAFIIDNYSSLLNYGMFAEDNTVVAEFKGLPFRLSEWLRIVAENRRSFNSYLYSNSQDNGAGLHVHLSRECVPTAAAEYIRSFLCTCSWGALYEISQRDLPNSHVKRYRRLASGKYGYITNHTSGSTWEIRIFQSPDSWKGLVRSLVWVALLIQKAVEDTVVALEGGTPDSSWIMYKAASKRWDMVYNELHQKFNEIYPKILKKLEGLPIKEEYIDTSFDEEDDDEECEDDRYYNPVTDQLFSEYDDYCESVIDGVMEDPYAYMGCGYYSISDLYTIGKSTILFESCFRDIWWTHDIYEIVHYRDDGIKESLYNELWDYVEDTPWRELLIPKAHELFFITRNNPYGRLNQAIRRHGYNEDALVEEFTEAFLGLDFPEWYRGKCSKYHRTERLDNNYDPFKYPTESALYDYLREAIRVLIREAIQTNWVLDWEPTEKEIVFEYYNPILEVRLFTSYSDLYPLLPLAFKGVGKWKVANALGVPLCWLVK